MLIIRSHYLFLFLYILFIIYGSLFPFADWQTPQQDIFSVWQRSMDGRISRSDLLTNFLVYIPFGFLLSSVLFDRFNTICRVLLVTTLGILLSLFMEYLQMYLPARTSSPVDLALNMISTLIGTLMFCRLGIDSTIGRGLRDLRHNCFTEGRIADIGLSVILLWGASQLAPFMPSIDVGNLKNGLKPVWLAMHDLSRLNVYRAATYALNIGSLGAVLLLLMKLQYRLIAWLGLYCGLVLLGKVTIVGRQLSFEALVGLCIGMLLTFILQKLHRNRLALAGILLVISAFIVDEIRPDMSKSISFHKFNWIPFSGQLGETVSGVTSIIEGIWPFVAIAFFAAVHETSARKLHPLLAIVGVVILVFTLEYCQSFIVGRYPDITTVILATIGWSAPWLIMRESE
jgi:VanZ family protein